MRNLSIGLSEFLRNFETFDGKVHSILFLHYSLYYLPQLLDVLKNPSYIMHLVVVRVVSETPRPSTSDQAFPFSSFILALSTEDVRPLLFFESILIFFKFCQFRPVLRNRDSATLFEQRHTRKPSTFGFLRLRIHLTFEDNTVRCVWVILSLHP